MYVASTDCRDLSASTEKKVLAVVAGAAAAAAVCLVRCRVTLRRSLRTAVGASEGLGCDESASGGFGGLDGLRAFFRGGGGGSVSNPRSSCSASACAVGDDD